MRAGISKARRTPIRALDVKFPSPHTVSPGLQPLGLGIPVLGGFRALGAEGFRASPFFGGAFRSSGGMWQLQHFGRCSTQPLY